jgi:hypothetical protein
MTNRVLITGSAGIVGSVIAGHLCQIPDIDQVILLDVNEKRGKVLADSLRIKAAMYTHHPEFVFEKCDLFDMEQTADLLINYSPNLVFQAATLFSYYFYAPIILRETKKRRIPNQYPAHTIAKDLTLAYQFMKSVKRANISPQIVNVAFPDHVNYILGKVGLAPTVGAGNIDVIVYMIRQIVAKEQKTDISQIKVLMVAHHALEFFPLPTTPFYLRMYHGDLDITKRYDKLQMLKAALDRVSDPFWEAGVDLITETTAASAAKNGLAMLNNRDVVEYTPGPTGLPGGYPTLLNNEGATVSLPDDITLEQAVTINLNHMQLDGVEKVQEDGTVIFTDPTVQLIRDILGLEWPQMKISQSAEMASQIKNAYQKLSRK